MMNIGITLKNYSYTPEAYAYQKYLSQRGWNVQLEYELDPNNDVNIYFMGLRPFWKREKGTAIEIHEYQSLSTPPYGKFKNFLKKVLNKKPNGRIYLNQLVDSELGFNDDIPYLYRDMGVDSGFFQNPNKNPQFDIIYSGSIQGRIGLLNVLLRLARFHKVIVVGEVNDDSALILKHNNISFTGRVSRKDLPELYRNARYGLNYTPDLYPYNIQTSTKTLEYLASGLHVISNRYTWAELFFNKLNYKPVWLDLNHKNDFFIQDSFQSNIPDMSDFEWGSLLDKSQFDKFLSSMVRNK